MFNHVCGHIILSICRNFCYFIILNFKLFLTSFQQAYICDCAATFKVLFPSFSVEFLRGWEVVQFMASVLIFSLIIAFSAQLFTRAQKCSIGQIYHLANWMKQTRKTVCDQADLIIAQCTPVRLRLRCQTPTSTTSSSPSCSSSSSGLPCWTRTSSSPSCSSSGSPCWTRIRMWSYGYLWPPTRVEIKHCHRVFNHEIWNFSTHFFQHMPQMYLS